MNTVLALLRACIALPMLRTIDWKTAPSAGIETLSTPARHGERLVIDSRLTERLRNNFFLETMIPQYADNLKSLRGFKFDWTRSDENYDHVYSAQAFTHKLNEFGIVHEAEEYNGAWGEPNWGEDGRIYTEVLQLFERHLVFAVNNDNSRK